MLTALDVAVGVAFCGTALAAPGLTAATRGWWLAVAVSWGLGSVPAWVTVHQAVLVVALICVPAAMPAGRAGVAACAGSVALVVSGLGQAAVAAAFLVAALGSRTTYGRAFASALGAVLATMWTWSRTAPESYRPEATVAVYDVLVVLVALTLPWGMRAHDRRRAARVEQLLADGPVGLDGLQAALRTLLSDDSLRLVPADNGFEVRTHRRLDEATSIAVRRAIELTADHELVQKSLAEQVVGLEAARRRLLDVADRERRRAISGLSADLTTLRAAQDAARDVPLVADELGRAARDIESIVAGEPPVGLGHGGIRAALEDLARRHPRPVATSVDPDAAGDPVAETAVYYVASEALANIAKHAAADHVEVVLQGGDDLVLEVRDDGVGGVEHEGAGITGLADRLATYGGGVRITCTPGAGTRVVARVPAVVTATSSADPHPRLE